MGFTAGITVKQPGETDVGIMTSTVVIIVFRKFGTGTVR